MKTNWMLFRTTFSQFNIEIMRGPTVKTASDYVKYCTCFLMIALASVLNSSGQADSLPAARQIVPADLVKLLQLSGQQKPLVLQVGSHVMYVQAHVPGSEYIGLGVTEAGLQKLKQRVEPLPRSTFIVLYCGCCPWSHCPNIKPADDALRAMGFTNVKVVHIADNFGSDWKDKGYPTAKGE
jgi:rhodanese-related sulfurtransferase